MKMLFFLLNFILIQFILCTKEYYLRNVNDYSDVDEEYITYEMKVNLCKEKYKDFVDEGNYPLLKSPLKCKVYCPIKHEYIPKSDTEIASYAKIVYNVYFPPGVKCDKDETCIGDENFTVCMKDQSLPWGISLDTNNLMTTSLIFNATDSVSSNISDNNIAELPTTESLESSDTQSTLVSTTLYTEMPIHISSKVSTFHSETFIPLKGTTLPTIMSSQQSSTTMSPNTQEDTIKARNNFYNTIAVRLNEKQKTTLLKESQNPVILSENLQKYTTLSIIKSLSSLTRKAKIPQRLEIKDLICKYESISRYQSSCKILYRCIRINKYSYIVYHYYQRCLSWLSDYTNLSCNYQWYTIPCNE